MIVLKSGARINTTILQAPINGVKEIETSTNNIFPGTNGLDIPCNVVCMRRKKIESTSLCQSKFVE